MKRSATIALTATLCLAACAHQPPPQPYSPGFMAGLFHGFVALFALVASLFSPLRIYAFPNAGFWYDTGFSIGFSASVVLLVAMSIARIGGFVTRGH